MHTNLPPSGGYDLFLTDIQDKYVIDVGSDRGSELLSRAPGVEDAVNGDLEAVLAFRQEKEAAVELHLNVRPENLPLALTARRNSKLWGEKAEKCLACGSCNTTCATCFCFDVLDRMNLSLADGVRERQWDGCLLPDFAMVGHGENFRSKGEARYRHRFYRKFDYLPVRYGGVAFCCGCGRCSVNCLADIANPVAVLNQVAEETAG
jgi:NAD-dependent dihydropyrimidine dehydrogenase PreA subunit